MVTGLLYFNISPPPYSYSKSYFVLVKAISFYPSIWSTTRETRYFVFPERDCIMDKYHKKIKSLQSFTYKNISHGIFIQMAQRGRPTGRQRFSQQKGGQRKQTMRELRAFIEKQAGDDGYGLFEAWLGQQDPKVVGGHALTPLELLTRQSQYFKRLVEGVGKLANQVSDYKKRQFYSIFRWAGLSRDALSDLGVYVGERGMNPYFFLSFSVIRTRLPAINSEKIENNQHYKQLICIESRA